MKTESEEIFVDIFTLLVLMLFLNNARYALLVCLIGL
jgi:hypothetical protein